MKTNPKNIVFLIRAYNDLDIQMSLIEKFAEDPQYQVRVVGYPCDGDIFDPKSHEAAPFMHAQYPHLKFETVFDDPKTPYGLRLFYSIERQFYSWQKALPEFLQILTKFPRIGLLTYLRKRLQGHLSWMDKIVKSWSTDIYYLDEVLVQKNRSDMIDRILPEEHRRGAKIFGMLTGQYVYQNPNPGGYSDIHYQKSEAPYFFVPHNLDKDLCTAQFPDENYVVTGNLRMNAPWITRLQDSILKEPYFPLSKYKAKLPNKNPIKICFMLSKMNYGIEANEIIETIRTVCNLSGIDVAIKPHTRGMKFDFMDKSLVGDAIDASAIPSAILCDWADITLFTGSGIVFHAMLLGKVGGFLKYCQQHETIFDNGLATENFETLNALIEFIEDFKKPDSPQSKNTDWLNNRLHNGHDNHDNAAFVKTKIEDVLSG